MNPQDDDVVYACVPGKLWSDSAERGVYRTTDGGATWSLVLQGPNPSTGCSGLTMDPHDPKVLLAGLWDFRRRGWTFRSGGDGPDAPSGSGLYRSEDGGTTWKEEPAGAGGLPAKPWGRVEVTFAPSDPKVVYALVESVHSALYRSADGGPELGGARPQPGDGLAPVLLRTAGGRSHRRRPPLQAGRRPDRQPGRRGELRRHQRRRARRLARRVDRSRQPAARHRRRRRRPVDLARRRQPVVEDEQPAGVAVLPRGRRRPGPLPGLRRHPGQQLLGGRLGPPRRHHQRALAGPLLRRRLLDRPRSHRPRRRLRRVAGRRHRPHRSPDRRGARDPADGGLPGETPLQLERADRRLADAEGHPLPRRPVPLPLARPRRQLGAHLPGPHHRRPGQAEAGGVRGRDGGQLLRRDAHHDLLDLPLAARRRT